MRDFHKFLSSISFEWLIIITKILYRPGYGVQAYPSVTFPIRRRIEFGSVSLVIIKVLEDCV